MDNQHPQTTTEGRQIPGQMQSARYVFTWRSKGLGANAKTIDDMIVALEDATGALRMLKEAGVMLDVNLSAGEDACLVTSDPAVAQRFGFTLEAAMQKEAQDES